MSSPVSATQVPVPYISGMDFQELLEVLQVEQVMGLEMLRYHDLPFETVLTQPEYRGTGTDIFKARLADMYPKQAGVLFKVLANTLNTERLLRHGTSLALTYIQAEQLAELFGCRPVLTFGDAHDMSLLIGITSADKWLSVFTPIVLSRSYDQIDKTTRHRALELLQEVLSNKEKAGTLHRTHPNELWELLKGHMNL